MFKFVLYSLALVGTGSIAHDITVTVASKIAKRNPDNPGIAYGIVQTDVLAHMFLATRRSPDTKEELHETLDTALEFIEAAGL